LILIDGVSRFDQFKGIHIKSRHFWHHLHLGHSVDKSDWWCLQAKKTRYVSFSMDLILAPSFPLTRRLLPLDAASDIFSWM